MMGNRSTVVKKVDSFVNNFRIYRTIKMSDGVFERPSRCDQDLVNKSDELAVVRAAWFFGAATAGCCRKQPPTQCTFGANSRNLSQTASVITVDTLSG